MSYRVLLVEDEAAIRKFVKINLEKEGYLVSDFPSAEEALEACKTQSFEIAVLDIMLEKMDGVTLLKILREVYPHMAIIMLTAKIEDKDKIKGLSLGADDYITKPFNPLELIARVKSNYRRYTKYNDASLSDIIYIDGLEIDENKHSVRLYDEDIKLTPIEFDILLYLAKKRGMVVSSEEIFEQVWKERYFESNNTVMVHIRRIREKLHEDVKKPKFIKTVWGVGYKIEK